jgi:energy-coupling factor transport system ATP-binding protein
LTVPPSRGWVDLETQPHIGPAVVFEDATFYFPDRGSVPALEGLRLEIGEGEFLAVAGLNGSGKSTLCRLINGLILPARGKVITAGLDTTVRENIPEIRRQVGLIMQNPDNQIVGPTVEDDVAFGLENLGLPRPAMVARVEEILEAMELIELRHREPHLLSMGERKRLAVAGALSTNPRILVSDESTSMLDPPTRAEVIKLYSRLRDEKGITVIHATHQPEEIMVADRVILLGGGRLLFDGTPDVLFEDAETAAEHGLRIPDLLLLALELEARGYPIPRRPLSAMDIVEEIWASS